MGHDCSARDLATQHGRELGRELAAAHLCDAIMRFRIWPKGDFEVTTQGATLSVASQHGH
jgi:hypothetical protein